VENESTLCYNSDENGGGNRPMEFNEKLQELRKLKGLTQEELAQELFVSRTAISKWESGRGYPNIDSLKAIGKFFCVTVDELLSGEEILTAAQENNSRSQARFRDLVFGLLDSSSGVFFFLPLFGQQVDGMVQSVSLLALDGVQPYLRLSYFAVTVITVLLGIATLALQNCDHGFWLGIKTRCSVILTGVGVFLFIISQQAYAAVYLLVFLLIKVGILIKKQ
jgi:transcriptional regulator with XRE-family HTH domain